MSVSSFPRCGPTILTETMPMLDGTPVLMCTSCCRIDTQKTWESRDHDPPPHVHRHRWQVEDYVCECGDVLARGLWR